MTFSILARILSAMFTLKVIFQGKEFQRNPLLIFFSSIILGQVGPSVTLSSGPLAFSWLPGGFSSCSCSSLKKTGGAINVSFQLGRMVEGRQHTEVKGYGAAEEIAPVWNFVKFQHEIICATTLVNQDSSHFKSYPKRKMVTEKIEIYKIRKKQLCGAWQIHLSSKSRYCLYFVEFLLSNVTCPCPSALPLWKFTAFGFNNIFKYQSFPQNKTPCLVGHQNTSFLYVLFISNRVFWCTSTSEILLVKSVILVRLQNSSSKSESVSEIWIKTLFHFQNCCHQEPVQ